MIHRSFEAIALVHCSSPCKDPKVVKDEDKTGKSEEAKRKTTLQLEEELAKKFATATDLKKTQRAAAKKTAAKSKPSEGSTDEESGSDSDGPRPMKAMKVKAGKDAKGAVGAMKVAMKGSKKKAMKKMAMKVIKTETKAKATKPDATEIPHYMSRKEAKCPKVGDGPVDYKHGRIYTSAARTAFRVIRQRGVFNTERQFRWAKKGKTDKKSFDAALQAVDDYAKK